MIETRRSTSRGSFSIPGLSSKHSFSFGEYHDPNHMGFHTLRVINDDTLAPGFGFPTHPHRNMEIITYVTEGTIEHQDSIGNREQIPAGDLQRMTAGSGVRHSEYNASKTEIAKLLQIWIEPGESGLIPSYEQKKIDYTKDGLTLAVSPDGEEGTLLIHQNARIYVGRIKSGIQLDLPVNKERYGWLQLIDGELSIAAETGAREDINPGDGVAISLEASLAINALSNIHFLYFDLP